MRWIMLLVLPAILAGCGGPQNYQSASASGGAGFNPIVQKKDDQFRPEISYDVEPSFAIGNLAQAIFPGNSAALTSLSGSVPRTGGEPTITASSVVSHSMGGWARFREARNDQAQTLKMQRGPTDVSCSGRASGNCTFIESVVVTLPIDDLRRVIADNSPGYRYKIFGGYEQPIAIPVSYIRALFQEMAIPLTAPATAPSAPPPAPKGRRR